MMQTALANTLLPLMVGIAIALTFASAVLLVQNLRAMANLKRDARGVLSGLTDGIVMLSSHQDRAFCNEAARAMLSLLPEPSLPDGYYRIDRSPLLGQICAAAASAKRDEQLAPIELVDAEGQFRTWRPTLIRAKVAGVQVAGVILHDRTEIHTLSHLLAESRRRDPLTGLATPELLHDRAGQALEAASRTMTGVIMLVIEVDQFEQVFEERGWHAASELLIQAAIQLSGAVRAMDLMARVGQDRFAVLVTSIGDMAGVVGLAERFLTAMRFAFTSETGVPMTISGSIGLARAGIDGATSLRLLEKANRACTFAREEGGDRVRLFDPDADPELPALDKGLIAELRAGLEQGRFIMLYQPIVALGDRRVTGYEALMRWRHPVRGDILPGAFIAAAERAGMIHALGDFALRQACLDAARWPPTMQVSVNLSVVELLEADAPRRILSALAGAELAPHRLRIEITETARIPDLGRLRTAVNEVRALGVTVALDDFGTGHSSLTHLQSLSFDCLKVDHRFIRDLATPRTADMIRMLIAYCRQIGVAVVAEGVETEAQARQLVQMGCSHAQGWLFGHPEAAASVADQQLAS